MEYQSLLKKHVTIVEIHCSIRKCLSFKIKTNTKKYTFDIGVKEIV